MDDTEMVFASGQVYLSPPLFQKCCETYQKKKGGWGEIKDPNSRFNPSCLHLLTPVSF